MKRALLALLGAVLFLVALGSPQGMIFPMWILVYLSRERLAKFADRFPLTLAFICLGTFFGLLTEFFAVLENLDVDYGERVLMSQDPVTDMLLAPAYYTLFTLLIYFLVSRRRFSKSSIFLVSGLYGIFTENGGTIFFGIFVEPFSGVIMAFLVMCVYAVFPLLAYMLTEHRFDPERPRPTWKTYLLLPPLFFLFWALFGNIVLPAFKMVFGG